MSVKIAEFPKSAADDIENQVGALQQAMDEAKTGNLETVMVIAMTRDGSVLLRWTATEDLMQLSSHLRRAEHLVQRRMDGEFDGK